MLRIPVTRVRENPTTAILVDWLVRARKRTFATLLYLHASRAWLWSRWRAAHVPSSAPPAAYPMTGRHQNRHVNFSCNVAQIFSDCSGLDRTAVRVPRHRNPIKINLINLGRNGAEETLRKLKIRVSAVQFRPQAPLFQSPIASVSPRGTRLVLRPRAVGFRAERGRSDRGRS